MTAKKITGYLPDSVLRYILYSLILTFFNQTGFANCIKQVNYSIVSEHSYAMESGVNFNLISNIDLLRGKPFIELHEISICINDQGFITETTTFTYGEHHPFPSSIHQTVTNSAFTRSYDVNGNLLIESPVAPEDNADIPGLGLAMNPEQIASFGEDPSFQILKQNFISFTQTNNGNFWGDEEKMFFQTPSTDIILSNQGNYVISNAYDSLGAIQFTNISTSKVVSEKKLPELIFNIFYYSNHNGVLFQEIEKSTVIDYEISENEQPVFAIKIHDTPPNINQYSDHTTTQFSTFIKPARLKQKTALYPNPAVNELFMNLTDDWDQVEMLEWTIHSTQGAIIKKGSASIGGKTLKVDLSEIPSGLYFIQCLQGAKSAHHSFIITK